MDWEKQYAQKVLDAKDSFDDVNKILRPHFPEFLYKYSRFNSDYWKNMIFKGELYFCGTDKLNDPFDGFAKVNLKEALREGTMLNQAVNQICSITEDEKLELADEILCGFQKDIRVASLTEINNSASMWDRYADGHKGFCIEYDVAKMNNEKKNMLFKVIYDEKPDITKQIENPYIGVGLSSIIFKDSEWSSEREWRMFKIYQGGKDVKYCFSEEIKAVYLGKNCAEGNKNIIIDWATKENKEVYQMVANYKKCKLCANRLI